MDSSKLVDETTQLLFFLFLLVNITFSLFPFFALNFLRVLSHENKTPRGSAIHNDPLRAGQFWKFFKLERFRKYFTIISYCSEHNKTVSADRLLPGKQMAR